MTFTDGEKIQKGERLFAHIATTHAAGVAMLGLMGGRVGEKGAKSLVVSPFLLCPVEQICNL